MRRAREGPQAPAVAARIPLRVDGTHSVANPGAYTNGFAIAL
jgi:hypothetical protein